MIQFESIFKAFENTNRTEDNLPELFKEIAKYFLTKGYFLVNQTKRIYICDVEFYYHEEKNGGIKDWIVYHRNNKGEEPEYFKVGQFNAHTSGVDITFECEDKDGDNGYRASMLIRGFKVVEELPLKDDDSIFKYDPRSTYFYEALLNCPMSPSGFTVQWIEKENEFGLTQNNILSTFRKNVPRYKAEDEKDEWTPGSDDRYFTSGKHKFRQCMRKWRFHLSNKTSRAVYVSK